MRGEMRRLGVRVVVGVEVGGGEGMTLVFGSMDDLEKG